MLKRNLIAATVTGLMLASNAVFAGDWAFDDAYWKQPVSQDATQVQSGSRLPAQPDPLKHFNDYNG